MVNNFHRKYSQAQFSKTNEKIILLDCEKVQSTTFNKKKHFCFSLKTTLKLYWGQQDIFTPLKPYFDVSFHLCLILLKDIIKVS